MERALQTANGNLKLWFVTLVVRAASLRPISLIRQSALFKQAFRNILFSLRAESHKKIRASLK